MRQRWTHSRRTAWPAWRRSRACRRCGAAPAVPTPRPAPAARGRYRRRARARAPPAARPTAPASAPAPTGRHSRPAARHCARLASIRSTDGRARGPIGRGGSCQMAGTSDGPSARSGATPASCSRSAGSSASPASWASATSARSWPENAAKIAHHLARDHAVAFGAATQPAQGRGGQRLCHLLDQSRQPCTRETTAARPRFGLVNQKVLERQDQDAAQRDRAGRPQQGQPAAHGRQQLVDRPAPVQRVDQPDDLEQLLVAGARHVAVETQDRQ